jgi:head-tail adaptor
MARGDRRHLVTFQNPVAVADGDGGYTTTWTDLVPATWHVSLEPATAADLERVAPGTVISSAAYVVRGDWHPGVTTLCRMLFNGRVFALTGVINRDLRDVEMECGAVEVVV